ncbi:hypothetical protein J3R30DRAFT_164945 [Lentinula aciculospora]|uniref:Crinkler effector protein N-terminal domain-containing protein n=1 Tax=Lentinula aciculospora TaxID=153920 RepID=A0A9W9AWQ9_9AGAR|nr:hypothetical protein J3R30DRAFT_164945 [Lentinula aciculospora]
MSSTGQHLVVYMPYDPTADAYRVYVPENAFVQDLKDAIAGNRWFKYHVGDNDLLLFKCNMETGTPDQYFQRAPAWLRENAKAARMRPASFLSEYFPDGPAPQKDRKIDVIAVTGTSTSYT